MKDLKVIVPTNRSIDTILSSSIDDKFLEDKKMFAVNQLNGSLLFVCKDTKSSKYFAMEEDTTIASGVVGLNTLLNMLHMGCYDIFITKKTILEIIEQYGM